MGGRTRAPYPSEYKAELVRLVREEGRSPSELAREFEPSAQSIMNWVASSTGHDMRVIHHGALDWQRPLDTHLSTTTLKPNPPETEQDS